MAQTCDKDFIIRRAEKKDINQLIELDREISFEFFKPLYKNYYGSTSLGQNPDFYLTSEIEATSKELPSLINSDRYVFNVATIKNEVVGFIIANRLRDFIQIDLLLIKRDKRNQGIGKALIKSLNTSSNLSVYVLKENYPAIKFYSALGFKEAILPYPDKINTYGLKYSSMFIFLRKD